MGLVPFWFIVVTVLWTGFFVLEGFDFGVGMLHTSIGADEAGRRAAINTIGPLWDGNEVWLIVAAAAIFAAFPGWYATMFSAFYLLFVLLLVALIIRGVSFEYRGKRDSERWRRTWDGLLFAGSAAAPFLIGVALGDLLQGVPIDSHQEFTGSLGDLFQPYAVFTGLTLVLLCVLYGAMFLTLKTSGELRERAALWSRRWALGAGAFAVAFAIWTHTVASTAFFLNPIELLTVLAAGAAVWLAYEKQEGFAFAAAAVTIAASIVSIFVGLYPNLMVSSTSKSFSLTVHNTAAGGYSLKVMTVVAGFLLPFVLAYQAWTYYIFRRRISKEEFSPPPPLGAEGDQADPARRQMSR
jgi:cytochrome bd-type quinol oxidase subunit 2